jgi:N-acyl-D-aspartate/D-glutamate deacylase
MIAMSLAADRPLNWNILVVTAQRKALVEGELSASDLGAKAGARIIALVNPGPMQSRRSFFTGFVLDAIPDWKPVLELPLDERMAALRSPEVRARLIDGTRRADPRLTEICDFPHYVIEETVAAENASLRGRMVADIAAERGTDPFDTILDVVLADGLRTTLLQPEWGADKTSWDYRSQIWRDPRVVLGASDAGAHLDTLSTFFYTTDLLGPSVRDHQRIGLEEAVNLITDVPARLYGLRDRGRIAEGWYADLVVFDPATIGHGPVHTRNDLPGGASRLFAEATGIAHVFVNGVEVLRDGSYTGAVPGALIRGGRDTDPVTL